MTSVLMKTDDPHWKEFVTKPSLKYLLQILSGLAQGHSRTQMLIAEHCIPILHQMEQVSSDEHVGSLAEGVLEAMKGCEEAEQKVGINCLGNESVWLIKIVIIKMIFWLNFLSVANNLG